MKKILLLLLSSFFVMLSCETEPEIEENFKDPVVKTQKEKLKGKIPQLTSVPIEATIPLDSNIFHENLRTLFHLSLIEPSECKPTEVSPILLDYLVDIASDPIAEQNFNLYLNLSRFLALMDTSTQYFGENGEYTSLMNKRIRELERFWNMPGELRVNGQHSESLNDRDKLARLFFLLSMDDSSWEMAYEAADEILVLNETSPNLPESPFFSLDGLITFSNIIVIGDGLVKILSETGMDPKIVWTSLLAHEWAHQIQLDHYEIWYQGEPNDPTRPNRMLELEADFFASYYLTHKRGATYNWKRVEQFLALFFQLGDCDFTGQGHHGTPDQRMRASRSGYELANDAQKKGQILTPEEVHQAFLDHLSAIL